MLGLELFRPVRAAEYCNERGINAAHAAQSSTNAAQNSGVVFFLASFCAKLTK